MNNDTASLQPITPSPVILKSLQRVKNPENARSTMPWQGILTTTHHDTIARAMRKLSRAQKLSAAEVEQIRAAVLEGIEEIERGEGKDYDGEEGLKQLFNEIRVQGLKELAAERRKRIRR